MHTTYLELPHIKCTTQPPIDENRVLYIPVNGYAMFICERETDLTFQRYYWYLISSPHSKINEISMITASRSEEETCVLAGNKTCDSMVAVIKPRAYDTPSQLNNLLVKGCTLISEIGTYKLLTRCDPEWIELRVTQGGEGNPGKLSYDKNWWEKTLTKGTL